MKIFHAAALAVVVGVCWLATDGSGAEPAVATLLFEKSFEPPGAHTVAFSEDGNALAVGGFAGAFLLRTQSGKELARIEGMCWNIRVLSDDALFIGNASGISVVDRHGRVSLHEGSGVYTHAVGAVSEDEKWVCGTFDRRGAKKNDAQSSIIVLRSLDGSERGRELIGHTGPVRGLSFHPSKPLLISCGSDGTSRLWDIESGKQIRQVGKARPAQDGGAGPVSTACSFNCDGSVALFGGTTVRVPEMTPVKKLAVEFEQRVLCGVFAGDCEFLVTGHYDGSVCFWDTTTFEKVFEMKGSDIGAEIRGVAVSKDGKYLAAASRGWIDPSQAARNGVAAREASLRVWEIEKAGLVPSRKQ